MYRQLSHPKWIHDSQKEWGQPESLLFVIEVTITNLKDDTNVHIFIRTNPSSCKIREALHIPPTFPYWIPNEGLFQRSENSVPMIRQKPDCWFLNGYTLLLIVASVHPTNSQPHTILVHMCVHSFLIETVYYKVAIPLLRKETHTICIVYSGPMDQFWPRNSSSDSNLCTSLSFFNILWIPTRH